MPDDASASLIELAKFRIESLQATVVVMNTGGFK